MRDEQQPESQLPPQPSQQFENLLLHGDVEGGGGLVGDQQPGARRQRHGDHGALAQTAGELVRKLPRAKLRLGHCGVLQCFAGPARKFTRGKFRLMRADAFLDLRPDAHHGVERRHWLLKNHGDFAAAHRHALALSERGQV